MLLLLFISTMFICIWISIHISNSFNILELATVIALFVKDASAAAWFQLKHDSQEA